MGGCSVPVGSGLLAMQALTFETASAGRGGGGAARAGSRISPSCGLRPSACSNKFPLRRSQVSPPRRRLQVQGYARDHPARAQALSDSARGWGRRTLLAGGALLPAVLLGAAPAAAIDVEALRQELTAAGLRNLYMQYAQGSGKAPDSQRQVIASVLDGRDALIEVASMTDASKPNSAMFRLRNRLPRNGARLDKLSIALRSLVMARAEEVEAPGALATANDLDLAVLEIVRGVESAKAFIARAAEEAAVGAGGSAQPPLPPRPREEEAARMTLAATGVDFLLSTLSEEVVNAGRRQRCSNLLQQADSIDDMADVLESPLCQFAKSEGFSRTVKS